MSRNRAKPDLQLPERAPGPSPRRRLTLVVVLLCLAVVGLLAQTVDLQVIHKRFYQEQGNARFLREVPIPVSRGSIFDRNGVPLAVSTPVESIWANPQVLLSHDGRIPQLAHQLGIDPDQLTEYLDQRSDREFVYLKRRMSPSAARAVLDLKIPGVNEQREYRRYYPLGAVTAHVLGFTNINDHGQEGLERTYDKWLSGKAGIKRVIKDRLGRTVENVDLVRAPKPGHNLTLSIDRRIQYLAYRQLEKTVARFKATSASMVIMDPRNGEVLAMVNLPSYNPNAVGNSTASQRRNRAVTDVVEPGSTAKAFTIAAALESGKWTPTTRINTSPGWIELYGHTIKDDSDNGVLSVTGVITKSSNIGAAKIALSLNPQKMYDVFRKFGFGESTQSGLPGESAGLLPLGADWRPIRQATIGYGYGFSVTALQLAQAYCVIADGGVMHGPSFVKNDDQEGRRIIPTKVANEVLAMLRTVVQPGGTAYHTASITNYTVAGKTGTSHIARDGGYSKSRYNSLFAGIVPASNPRLVGVVIVRGAQGGYFGSTVAAPVFSAVMKGALRLLDVPPDNVPQLYASSDGVAASDAAAAKGGG